ncbi:MAG: hypothetical protein IJD78_04390 [Clostridia bacterium]|nr:hypothetical protein [Clostridia bacterium]
MINILIFDKPYPPDLIAEGQAIQWAVMSGACDRCSHRYECEHNRNFKFPKRADCMKKKAELLKKMKSPLTDGNR